MELWHFCKRIFSQEYVDRTISGGIKPQVTLLVVTIIVSLVIFSSIVILFSIPLGGGEEWSQRIWIVYNNFVDAGNQVSEVGWINRLLVSLISTFGSILLGGVLISTISNIIERRVEAVRIGKVTYQNLFDHCVIIGYGEITASLIRELHKENPNVPVVLMTNQNVEEVRRYLQSQLDKEDEFVKIYFGNIESTEELTRLNIFTAKEVYILGEQEEYGRDSKNIECVRYVSELRGDSKGQLLPVYVQFDRIPSYSNIQKLTLPSSYFSYKGTPNLFFRPFNFHESWARRLWSLFADSENFQPLDYHPIKISKNTKGQYVADCKDYVHLIIVGFNRMGRALLLEALRICHFANYDDSKPEEERLQTVITLVDKEMDLMKDYFESQYPYINKQIDDIRIEYRNDDICSPKMRADLNRWAQDKHRMLTIAICMGEPDMSLSIGLNLPSSIYEKDIPVLIRQELQTGLGKLINVDQEGKYKHVKIFGMLDQGVQKCMLDDTLAAYINQYYNCEYCRAESEPANKKCSQYKSSCCKYATASINGKYKNEYIKRLYTCYAEQSADYVALSTLAYDSWFKLSEINKWANRYQLDAYAVFCRSLGYKVQMGILPKLNTSPFQLDKPAMRMLMRMEKYRWNAERSIEGWRYGKTKDSTFQTHPLLLPFIRLEQEKPQEIEKDKDVIENLPYLLGLGKYELKRYPEDVV